MQGEEKGRRGRRGEAEASVPLEVAGVYNVNSFVATKQTQGFYIHDTTA